MLACSGGLAEKDVEPRGMRLDARPLGRPPGALGQLHGLLRVPARLGGVTEVPRGPRGFREHSHPVVEWRGELRRLVVQSERAAIVLTRARKVAREKAGHRLCVVRQHQQRWAARLFGRRQRLIGERLRRLGAVPGERRHGETE